MWWNDYVGSLFSKTLGDFDKTWYVKNDDAKQAGPAAIARDQYNFVNSTYLQGCINAAPIQQKLTLNTRDIMGVSMRIIVFR